MHLSIEGSIGRMLAHRELGMHRAARLLSTLVLVLGAIGIAIVQLVWQLAGGLFPDNLTGTAVWLASLTIPFTLAAQMSAALLFRVGALVPYGWVVAAAAALQIALVLVVVAAGSLTPELTLAVILAALVINAIALCTLVTRRLGMSALIPAVDFPAAAAYPEARRRPASIDGRNVSQHAPGFCCSSARSGEPARRGCTRSRLHSPRSRSSSRGPSLSALRTQTEASEEVAVAYTVNLARQTLALAVCSAVALSVLAYPIVRICFGEEWTASAAPLAILSLGAVALSVEGPVRGLLVRIAPLRHISAAAVAALMLGIALDLVLIPTLGINGAAIASVLSYWTAALLMLWLLRREAGTPPRAILAWPRSTDAIVRGIRRLSTVRST